MKNPQIYTTAIDIVGKIPNIVNDIKKLIKGEGIKYDKEVIPLFINKIKGNGYDTSIIESELYEGGAVRPILASTLLPLVLNPATYSTVVDIIGKVPNVIRDI